MIGRVIYAAFLIAGLTVTPVWAAPTSSATAVTGVTYSNGVIRWERLERRPLRPKTITRLSILLAPGGSKLIARGRPGLVVVRVQYAQRDGGPVVQRILSTTLIRKAEPRIVAQGIGPTTLAAFEARGVVQMASVARDAIHMMATAYTAGSAGGDGMTASGRRAGYGIVAVDPRIIPLGTHLYIPGYGMAVAGDTGGAIVGHRIDLGFDSLRGAMLFGRRDVTVYRLK
ncbi:MAG TPA: 3D domain-containing protein [Candidatus Cybelea sp.]|nr:3D domain-containing protein [Candidatus Cybelea sp.]